ncbi:hypothetical protein PM082_009769 [Marasmius tenuissimus]|nr:hypothetical protein PM082_009769 [Marasmius tenuissimus]
MTSSFFQNAQNFTIAGGSFNHVEGDQHIYNGPTKIIQKRIKKRTEFDEFYSVKRGAILRLRDICYYRYPREWDDDLNKDHQSSQHRADKTVCVARLLKESDAVFTVVQYSGPEAHRAFEEDFRALSRKLTSNVSQLYGYNQSYIPSLILYNELMPIAQLRSDAGLLVQRYLDSLSWRLDCTMEELWLDTGRGMFCSGPPGPRSNLSAVVFNDLDLPLTAELLQEDVLLGFLASVKSKQVDRVVMRVITDSGVRSDVPERVSKPTVISTLTNTPIAVASNAWESMSDCLSDRRVLENGLSRFTLSDDETHLLLCWNWDATEAWLSQVWSIFYARGVSLEDDLSVYKVIRPGASLGGPNFSDSQVQRHRRSQQPIYLFMCPPPLDMCPGHYKTSSLHFWSFDEDGLSPLPSATCSTFGLPLELDFLDLEHASIYTNHSYKRVQQYQVLRGFDPSTTNFARHLGYYQNIYQPLSDLDRFTQIQQEPEWESPKSAGKSTSRPAGTRPAGFLSSLGLFSPLSSTVSNDSDILTIGF